MVENQYFHKVKPGQGRAVSLNVKSYPQYERFGETIRYLRVRAVLENNVQMENKNSPYLPQPFLVKEGRPKVLPLNKGELEGVLKDKTFEKCSNGILSPSR